MLIFTIYSILLLNNRNGYYPSNSINTKHHHQYSLSYNSLTNYEWEDMYQTIGLSFRPSLKLRSTYQPTSIRVKQED